MISGHTKRMKLGNNETVPSKFIQSQLLYNNKIILILNIHITALKT